MKNKVLTAILGIGIGVSSISPALAATCKSELEQCLENTRLFEQCEGEYRRCVTLDRDECEI